MTNKLPVVGKRYRLKNYKAEVINVDSEGVTYLQGDKEYWDFLDDFRDYFEELPEDKAETISAENAQAGAKDNIFWSEESISECGRFKIKTGTTSTFEYKIQKEEQSISFEDAIYNLKHEVENIKYGDDLKINPASIVEDMLQKKLARLVDKAEEVINAETKPENQSHISESKEKMKQALDIIRNRKKYLEGYNNGFDDCLKEVAEHFPEYISELSPEVKEAMELMQFQIDHHDKSYVTEVDPRFLPPILLKVLERAKNLLNALDKQFMLKEEDKIDTSSEVCLSNNEMKPNENGSFKHLDNAEEISQEIMKKSTEESIWKPVSELPNYPLEYPEKILVKYLSGEVEMRKEDNAFVGDEKFCRIGDFINDYEKLKERVRKLEGK